MSKKIQTVVPDNMANEIDIVIEKKRFADQSEFVRHCIREYLNTCLGDGNAHCRAAMNIS